jgi:hypothetical protein
MLPPVTSPVWKKLVNGEKQIDSKNFVINMLLTNTQIRYKQEPTKLDELVKHAYEVFSQHEKTIASELAQLVS